MSDKEPTILIDTYGKRAPDAAKFGKGVGDRAGVDQATSTLLRRPVRWCLLFPCG